LSRCQPRPYSGSAVLSRFELPFSQFSRLAVGDFFDFEFVCFVPPCYYTKLK
jgi:hypothetical protein